MNLPIVGYREVDGRKRTIINRVASVPTYVDNMRDLTKITGFSANPFMVPALDSIVSAWDEESREVLIAHLRKFLKDELHYWVQGEHVECGSFWVDLLD